MATIAADVIAAGIWPQPQPVRQEAKVFALWITNDRKWLAHVAIKRAASSWLLHSSKFVTIAKLDRLTFAQRNAQRKANLICDLAQCVRWGQHRTNLLTSTRGDKSAMQPFAKLLWTLVILHTAQLLTEGPLLPPAYRSQQICLLLLLLYYYYYYQYYVIRCMAQTVRYN